VHKNMLPQQKESCYSVFSITFFSYWFAHHSFLPVSKGEECFTKPSKPEGEILQSLRKKDDRRNQQQK
jgi:hypothetical protein